LPKFVIIHAVTCLLSR